MSISVLTQYSILNYFLKVVPLAFAMLNKLLPVFISTQLTAYFVYAKSDQTPRKPKWENVVKISAYLLYLGIASALFYGSGSHLLYFIPYLWAKVLVMACCVPYLLKGIQAINHHVLLAITSPTAQLLRPLKKALGSRPLQQFANALLLSLAIWFFFPVLSAFVVEQPFLFLLTVMNVSFAYQDLSQMISSIGQMIRHIVSSDLRSMSFHYDGQSLLRSALAFAVVAGIMWHQFTVTHCLDKFLLQALLVGLRQLEFLKPLEKIAEDFYQTLGDFSFLSTKTSDEDRQRITKQLPSARFFSHRVFNTPDPNDVPVEQRRAEFFAGCY